LNYGILRKTGAFSLFVAHTDSEIEIAAEGRRKRGCIWIYLWRQHEKAKFCGDRAWMTIFLAAPLSEKHADTPIFAAAAQDCTQHLYTLIVMFYA